MTDRFCTTCGTALQPESNFCVGCGRPLRGQATRQPAPIRVRRYATLVVVGSTVLVGAIAVIAARLDPVVPPSVPGRSAPGNTAMGQMPEGHPPIDLPDDVKRTIADLRKEAEAAPTDLKKWEQLAGVEYRAGRIAPAYLSQAASSYQRVLELAPENADALRSLGNIAFDSGQPEQSIAYYQRYLEKNPGDLNVLTDMATMHLAKKDLSTAIDLYTNVLAQRPDFFQASFNLGIAYQNQGNVEQAVATLNQAKKVAPDDHARAQVEQLLARVTSAPAAAPPAGGVTPTPVAGSAKTGRSAAQPAGASGGQPDFRTAVEAVFRTHAMIGPKTERFDWPDNATVRAIIRDFPIGEMPESIRTVFTDKIRAQLKEAKQAHGIDTPVTVEMVDPVTETVMETVTE